MSQSTRAAIFKQGLLLFWALWISIVVAMNVGDVLKASEILPSNWPAASGNYAMIVKDATKYGLPGWVDGGLFAGAILWEASAALLFWRALRQWRSRARGRWQATYLAHTALFGLFATFILADEVFHDYKVEADHRGICLLLLCSLLVLQLLPEKLQD